MLFARKVFVNSLLAVSSTRMGAGQSNLIPQLKTVKNKLFHVSIIVRLLLA
jgi:hypothetical protein